MFRWMVGFWVFRTCKHLDRNLYSWPLNPPLFLPILFFFQTEQKRFFCWIDTQRIKLSQNAVKLQLFWLLLCLLSQKNARYCTLKCLFSRIWNQNIDSTLETVSLLEFSLPPLEQAPFWDLARVLWGYINIFFNVDTKKFLPLNISSFFSPLLPIMASREEILNMTIFNCGIYNETSVRI